MFRHLDASEIVTTLEQLLLRIDNRFPDSGLARVGRALLETAQESVTGSSDLGRPMYLVRAAVWVLIVVFAVLPLIVLVTMDLTATVATVGDLAQMIESGVNDLVFVGIGVFFLVTIETRIKRGRALAAIRELRSVAHIVDLHQLSKDPEIVIDPEEGAMDPPQKMTRFELARYLDYSSEMLSLTGKIAALYVQHFDDRVALQAVTEIETLTTGLSRKIWQKVMILDTLGSSRG